MHTKAEQESGLGEANLWRIAPVNHQQAGRFDFLEPAGTIIGSPSVVPIPSIIAPLVVLSITLTAPAILLTTSLTTGGTSTIGAELDSLTILSRTLRWINSSSKIKAFLDFFSYLHCLFSAFSSLVRLERCLLPLVCVGVARMTSMSARRLANSA